jgi:hypothetical protein
MTRARRRTRDEGAFDTLLVPAGPSDGGITEQPRVKTSEPPVPIASLLTISSTFEENEAFPSIFMDRRRRTGYLESGGTLPALCPYLQAI